MNYMDAVKEVRNRLKGTHGYISRGNAWKIFLQSRGKGDQSEESMYSDIRRRRAAHMLELAEGGNDTAKNFIKSMGVNQIDDGAGNMTFTEGALDLLAEKLK